MSGDQGVLQLGVVGDDRAAARLEVFAAGGKGRVGVEQHEGVPCERATGVEGVAAAGAAAAGFAAAGAASAPASFKACVRSRDSRYFTSFFASSVGMTCRPGPGMCGSSTSSASCERCPATSTSLKRYRYGG